MLLHSFLTPSALHLARSRMSYHGTVILPRQRSAAFLIAFLLVAACPRICLAQLERAVDQALGKAPGTVVVLDIASGKILASRNLELAAKQLIRPGSTLKPFVLEGLLSANRIDSEQRLVCKRPLRIGSLRLDCSHAAEIKQLNAAEAIAYSCNSYVAETSVRLNEQELAEALRRAGLDSPTGLVEREAVGHIEHTSTREQLQLMALGLRGIEVTTLELLEAYRKLALQRPRDHEPRTAAIYKGLEDAVTYGTAHAAFVPGLKIAGKTGTATNVGGAVTHGLFVGYTPAEHPEIAIVVYLDRSRGLDAAAVAQTVLARYKPTEQKP